MRFLPDLTLRCGRRAAAMLLAAAVVSSHAGTAGALPTFESTGPDSVEVVDVRWRDPARSRELPLRLRLPASATAAQPQPVILFSHGLGGSVDAGTLWAEHWASHGFVVIHLEHPGSNTDSVVRAASGPLDAVRRAKQAASGEQLIARAQDVRFVLDELARRRSAGDPVARRIDLARVGMAGHSFGAGTTQAVAGQHYPRQPPSPLVDPRPRAFMAFSPSMRENDRAESFSGITRPMMGLTGTEDGMVGAGLGVPPAQRLKPFEFMPAGDKFLVNLTNADHATFGGHVRDKTRRLDGAGKPRSADPAVDAVHTRLIRTVTLAYWRATLLDDASARAWLATAGDYIGQNGTFSAK